jgi:UDP-N-acetylglucosamine pyrophosphorylase
MEQKNAEVLNKVIRRTYWDEKVGYFVDVLGKTECIEYSEIPENISKLKEKDPYATEADEKEEEDEYD